MKPSPPTTPSGLRAGFSLLEVLVACGILAVALGSIAAMLPAAGARLAEAAAQDRAAAAVAAAMAELQARNMVTRATILTGTGFGTGTFSPAACVFGETLSLAATSSATTSGFTVAGALAVTASTGNLTLTSSGSVVPFSALYSGTFPALATSTSAIATLINSDTSSADRRGFFLEDEVRYTLSGTTGLPANSFVGGVREFNRGVCWGAMITPVGAPWATTTAARVSVAVFRKPGNATALTLTATPTPTSSMFVTGSTTPASLQRSILKPCSMVLAINGTATPQWLPIGSSWTLTGTMVGTSGTFTGVSGTNTGGILSSGAGRTCVSFSRAVPPSLVNSGTLTVIGFEQLLLVDERVFPLP